MVFYVTYSSISSPTSLPSTPRGSLAQHGKPAFSFSVVVIIIDVVVIVVLFAVFVVVFDDRCFALPPSIEERRRRERGNFSPSPAKRIQREREDRHFLLGKSLLILFIEVAELLNHVSNCKDYYTDAVFTGGIVRVPWTPGGKRISMVIASDFFPLRVRPFEFSSSNGCSKGAFIINIDSKTRGE